MATTFSSLQFELSQYLGREDLAVHLPRFIELAEARMNRELRLTLMEREATRKIPALTRLVCLPDKRVPGDWDVFLEMRDLRLNGSQLVNLDFLPPDGLPESRSAGQPRAYSIRGRELALTPAPSAPCELLLTYYAQIPPLSVEQPTNELLLRAPDLYLYGALSASAAYTRASAPLELWERAYQSAATSLSRSDVGARFTANLAMRPIRAV